MGLTEFMKRLGAPLAVARKSWGSVREKDGAVFLKVWRDRVERRENDLHVRITSHDEHKDDPTDYAYAERLRHIELIRQGAKCYLVMCAAKDPEEQPRAVGDFDSDRIFPGSEITEHDGELWITLGRPVLADGIRPIKSPPSDAEDT